MTAVREALYGPDGIVTQWPYWWRNRRDALAALARITLAPWTLCRSERPPTFPGGASGPTCDRRRGHRGGHANRMFLWFNLNHSRLGRWARHRG